MNKNNLNLLVGSAIATGLLCSIQAVQAGENPFAISEVNQAQQVAESPEATNTAPMPEGKCGSKKAEDATKKETSEGKCGANKTEATIKKDMPEGKCGEGKCGANKK